MGETYEFLFPAITAVVALVPLIGVARAYARVRSPRLLFAMLAFVAFVASGVLLVAFASLGFKYADAAEWVEFGSDVLIVALFAISFLWPRREPKDG